jgi:hypothetical protein
LADESPQPFGYIRRVTLGQRDIRFVQPSANVLSRELLNSLVIGRPAVPNGSEESESLAGVIEADADARYGVDRVSHNGIGAIGDASAVAAELAPEPAIGIAQVERVIQRVRIQPQVAGPEDWRTRHDHRAEMAVFKLKTDARQRRSVEPASGIGLAVARSGRNE